MPRIPTHSDVVFHRDPELPGIEIRLSSYSEHAFRRHVHDAYSVALVEKGATTFELEGTLHRALAGQLVLISPGKPHACNPDGDAPMTYRMFYIEPEWFEGIASELNGGERRRPDFARPVVDDRELFEAWRALHVALMDDFDRLEKESSLVENIARTIERYGVLPSQASVHPPVEDAVAIVRGLLSARLTEKVTLNELAEATGYSRYHLLRMFRDATGLPPHAYLSQLRVALAKRLLADGSPPARVARECGFSDQSHFTRVFREFTGATPSQYQASVVASH